MSFNELLPVEQHIFKLAPNSLDDYLKGERRWVKSEKLYVLKHKDEYVVFNTLLNSPVVINYEAKQFLDATDSFSMPINSNSLETDFLLLFMESYFFLPFNIREDDLIKIRTASYLQGFSTGSTFETFDLRISESCNFGCRHCIAGGSKHSTFMTFDEAKCIIDRIIKLKLGSNKEYNLLQLHYGNAEPLLNYGIIPLIHSYVASEYPRITLQGSISTNLSLIDRHTALWLKENNISVYTSLDGQKKGNDSIRVQKNGEGTYDIILEKLQLFQSIGYPIKGISVTITDENFPFVQDEFIDWCASQQFDSVAYDFDLINTVAISIDEATDFLVCTWKRFRDMGIEFYGTWASPFLNISNKSFIDEIYGFCKAKIGRNLSIDSQGSVYICAFSSIPICNLKEIDTEIKDGGKFYKYVASNLLGKNELCKKCRYEGACIGQCDVTKEHSAEKIKYQCRFYKSVTDKTICAQVDYEELEGGEDDES